MLRVDRSVILAMAKITVCWPVLRERFCSFFQNGAAQVVRPSPLPGPISTGHFMTQILDGKRTAARLRSQLRTRVLEFQKASGVTPQLVAVLVGDDPASRVYVRNKERACREVGIDSQVLNLPADTTMPDLLATIDRLNADPAVHGILVQLPLPPALDSQTILDTIDPRKDVDAFHPENVGRLVQGRPRFLPCTPHGVLQILQAYQITTAGKHVVVVGRSDIVGKPMALLLVQKDGPLGKNFANATVTFCHSRTTDLIAHLQVADIVVAAVGVPGMITGDMLKPGCVVIDVGINRVKDESAGERLVGDVDFASASQVASSITPVPGGIGPLTVAMLLENTFTACQQLTSVENAQPDGTLNR